MIEQLLPPEVQCAEAFGDLPDAFLLPEEVALIQRAVEKRRTEFATARHLARQALGKLGHEPVPLLRGERGAPLWPAGVVGSITHCTGYRAAAAVATARWQSVGIDAEPNAPLPDGVLSAVSLPAERDVLTRLAGEDQSVAWDRLLFSAKESVYKTWFPITRAWLGFEDAEITINPKDGNFTAVILPSGRTRVSSGAAPRSFTGRWSAEEGLVVTAIAYPAG